MRQNIQFRQATRDNAPDIVEIITKARQKHYGNMFSHEELFGGPAMESSEKWETRLKQENNHELTFLAYLDNTPVFEGSLELNTPKYGEGVTEITSFFGHPHYNRQGFATQMFQYLCETAKKKGQTRVVLCALEDNTAGRAFYEKINGTLNGDTDITHWCGRDFKRLYYTWDLS